MPAKAHYRDDVPEWIYDMSIGDECLLDVLTEAWVARSHARKAISQRGKAAPKRCLVEFDSAEEIMKGLRSGSVAPRTRSKRASVAVRKFTTARQCAIYLDSDRSRTFARDRKRGVRSRS